ncbi:hypothetical protein HK100_000766, partial [Physocladia obscura]
VGYLQILPNASIQTILATLYIFMEQYDKALSIVNKLAIIPNAVSFFAPKSNGSIILCAYRDLLYGLVHFFNGEYKIALPLLESSYETIHSFGDRTAGTDILKCCYGICLLFLGSVDDALHVLVTADGAIFADSSTQFMEQCLGLAMLHYKAEIWLRATRAKVYTDLGRVSDSLETWRSLERFVVERYGSDDSYAKIAVAQIADLHENP